MSRSVILKIKIKVHFTKRDNKQKCWCDFELVRLTITLLSCNGRKSISTGAKLSTAHVLCMLTKYLFCKKLSHKQSGSVIFRPARLNIIDRKRISVVVKLYATHTFN